MSSERPITLGQKLLAFRVSRGLSLRTLADRAGLSPSFISQVERDEASPSIASLERITEALGLDMATLFSRDTSELVVRSAERDRVESEWSRGYAESLSRIPGKLRPRLITLDAGGGTGAFPADVSEVFAYVLSGSLTARLGSADLELSEGDALHTLREHGLVELKNSAGALATLLLVSVY